MQKEQNQGLLTKNIPQNKGQLLYQSLLKLTPNGQSLNAYIYQKCLLINNSECIRFRFDVKFGVTTQQIKFECYEEVISYYLVNNDKKEWKNVLKNLLNQRGFHQEFKPIKKIGKGNFASVYLTEKIQDKIKYAVKAFSKEAAFSQENGKQCLIKEIEIMRHLNHKNNMKLHQVYQSDNSLYIVFELLDGGQLFQKIKAKTKFKQEEIKTMVYGLLSGLRQLHSKNIMHRDLKPQNILFRKQGDYDCVIADYGLAQFADEDNYLFVRCGTPGYVAPQVINIKDMKTKYSPICDMFSLGLIFHLLLLGRSAFKGSSYNQVLCQNRACDFKLQGQEYQKIAPQALDLLKKMLRINPQERITAEQALDHPYFKTDLEQDSNSTTLSEKENQVPQIKSLQRPKKQNQDTQDSCVKLTMGKQNMLTGNTKTVNAVDSSKISFVGNASGLKNQKASKFARQVGTNQQ